jgi:hypothetical protein
LIIRPERWSPQEGAKIGVYCVATSSSLAAALVVTGPAAAEVMNRMRTKHHRSGQWMTPKVKRELTTQFPPRDPQSPPSEQQRR